MIATYVSIWVKKECVEDFIKASILNHNGSIKEEGNLRFDLLQHHDDPTCFTFYEVYKSEEAAAEHKNTPHYHIWKEYVEDMMVKPREGVHHSVIAPLDEKLW